MLEQETNNKYEKKRRRKKKKKKQKEEEEKKKKTRRKGIAQKFPVKNGHIQHFKGFGARGALKFNSLKGLEASVAPNPLKC